MVHAHILENETYKILWNFDMKTDHLNTIRRSNQIFINKKKNLSSSGFCRSKVKMRGNEKINKYLNFSRKQNGNAKFSLGTWKV